MENDERVFIALLSLALAIAPAHARAQDAATVAEGLFREGIALLQKGEINEACSKLAESQRLDPSSGTLLNLADCHDKQGKTATAWAEFLAAARLAKSQGRPERAVEAKKRASELEGRLSHLRLVLSERVPGLRVELDAVTLEASALGSKIPVDPGERVVRVSAPGYQAASSKIEIGPERDFQTVTLPKLVPLPAKTRTSARPAGPRPVARSRPAVVRESPPLLAYAIGGTGVIALGTGGVFALLSRSAYSDADAECPSHSGCSSRAIALRDRAEVRANVANVAFGIGIVGVGIGAVLLLSGSSDPERSASAFTPGGATF